jgi:hypothetical protein
MTQIKRAAVVVASAVPALSMAAVPAGAEAIFTTVATDFATLLGYGFTAMAAIVGGMIVFGLVKKVAKKSTSA